MQYAGGPADGAPMPRACEAGSVLARMRNPDGGPDWRLRLLAVVLAVLLAGPLTVLLVRTAGRLLDAAL